MNNPHKQLTSVLRINNRIYFCLRKAIDAQWQAGFFASLPLPKRLRAGRLSALHEVHLHRSKNNCTIRRPLIVLIFVPTLFLFLACAQTERTPSSIDNPQHQTWSEKLGYPKGKKVLLLHMDDLGMCPEANAAAERYIEKKQILSGSVMMPCPEAAAFIGWAKEHPETDIGLHLTLTSEWKTYRWPPVTDASKVPGLIDPDGKFWHEVPDVVAHASAAEVEMEIRSQIEKSLALGHTPSHIDTHMGTLYGSPEYARVFFKVAQEYNIPANAIDVSVPEVADAFRKQGYPINDVVLKILNDYRLPKLDNFTSVPRGSTYEDKRANFLGLVNSLSSGLTEIIFHPSVESDNLRSITNSWQQRVWEAQLFADPLVQQFFVKEGIVITNWKDIMQRFGARKELSGK